MEEAVKAGAPENIIGWIEEPTILKTQELMKHPKIDCILATGGPGMVKSAYSSGKPALGVGAGNTPAIIDETADIKMAVSSILMSKTFDNGMICASEQSIVCVKDVYDDVRKELEYRGAYLLSAKEKEKLSKVIFIDGKLNAGIVGQPAYKIAEMAGVKVPVETKALVGEASEIGHHEPFSAESSLRFWVCIKPKILKKQPILPKGWFCLPAPDILRFSIRIRPTMSALNILVKNCIPGVF